MSPSPEIKMPARDVLSVAVIGNDTLLAAVPAHPIQLAHGCHLLGYQTVVPASWGDELVAEAILRDAERRGRRPAIVCACERARARLTGSTGELEPFLISTIAPPVAAARYLRSMLAHRRLDITFIGDCFSGADPVFDARFAPDVFLVRLQSAGIDLTELPAHYDNRVPPDRRRHASLPGGCPTPEALARWCPDRQLVELTESNLAIELAQQLLAHHAVLLDVAPGVGCACAGVRRDGTARTARVAVTSLEPPRAHHPIVDAHALIDVSIASLHPEPLALLARDPAADAEQSELPFADAAGGEQASAPVPPAAGKGLRLQDTAGPVVDHGLVSAPTRERRPLAITPTHALREISSGPAGAAIRLAASLTGKPEPLALPVGPDVELNALPVLATTGVTEANTAAEWARPPSPVTQSPQRRELAEDPIAVAQRLAQARILARSRSAPTPRTDAVRSAITWVTVLVVTLVIAATVLARIR